MRGIPFNREYQIVTDETVAFETRLFGRGIE
jgi:hypothetical protein